MPSTMNMAKNDHGLAEYLRITRTYLRFIRFYRQGGITVNIPLIIKLLAIAALVLAILVVIALTTPFTFPLWTLAVAVGLLAIAVLL